MAGSGQILLESAAPSSVPCDLPPVESHFREAFAKIDGMRKAGALLCDVTVVFGNGNHIKAHKLVLASCSKFFRTLFVDPTLGFSSVIKVQDSSEEVGHLLIEFAYTAHLDINEFNVIEILHGAEKLGFEQVERLCMEALRTRFDLNRVQGMDLPNLINLVNRFEQRDVFRGKEQFQHVELHPESQPIAQDVLSQKEGANSHYALPKPLPIVAFAREHQGLQQQPFERQSQPEANTSMTIVQQEMDLADEIQLQQQQQQQLLHSAATDPRSLPPEPSTTDAHRTTEAQAIQQRPIATHSQFQHQQPAPQHKQPVYVELTPGHIVLMTSAGNIRKIRLSDEVFDAEPEALTLRVGAEPSCLSSPEAEDKEGEERVEVNKDANEKLSDATEETDARKESSKKKRPSSRKKSPQIRSEARKVKNGRNSATASATLSDFDRKLKTLSRFEKCLSEASLKSVLLWQSEPLKRRRVLCALCPAVVAGTYHDLMEHVWKEHGPAVSANDELATARKDKSQACKMCAQKFQLRSDLTSHVKNVHNGFGCKFCGVESNSPQDLKAHETTCEKNPSALSTPGAGLIHQKLRVPCDECGKSFSNSTSLKTHVHLLHGDASSVAPRGKKSALAFCVNCQKSFSNKTVLDSHIRMVHLGEKEVPKPCPDCGKQYTMRAMREHRKRDHQGLRYQCPDCPSARLFTTKIMLTRHREVVHQKRRFRCTLCLAEFVDRCAWKLHHEAEHVGRRYPCPQCSKQFKRPGDVRRHIREVHQRCRYTCQHCEKSFSQQAKLKLHIRSLHMGNYPHTCSFCGKGFLRPSTLKGHIAKEHGSHALPDELLLIKQSLDVGQT